MTRKYLGKSTQARVLLRSRRRCCICFGLNRDTSLKRGQLAHLDRDHANDSEDNLAYLCLEHHDVYDSKTSQSKNFTVDEVKEYRNELDAALKIAFSSKVVFGSVEVDLFDPSGHYIRDGEFESAELTVRRMDNGQFHVSGLALWGKGREYGPNLGELDFVADLRGDTLQFQDGSYHISLRFADGSLSVTEENWLGQFGMNVSFSGEYSDAG